MGFNMIMKKPLVLLMLLSVAMVSCIKQPELDETNVPSSVAEVYGSIADAWGESDPLSMKKGDFIYNETTQQIETQNPSLVLQEGTTVSNVGSTVAKPNEINFTYIYQTRVIKSNGDVLTNSREDHRTFITDEPVVETAKVAAKALLPMGGDVQAMADDLQMSLGFENVYGLALACQKTEGLDKYCRETLKVDSCRVECSNLKTADEIHPAPDLIKTRPNCSDLPGCMMRLKKVSFDWAIIMKIGDSTETQKINYSVSLSPDLPFFSRMVQYCSRQLYAINASQKVLVTTCNNLKDFKKGTN